MKKTLLPILCVLSLMGCNDNQTGTAGKSYRTPAGLKLESDVMTPEVLWAFGRIGNVQVSPDGSRAVYAVTYFNKEEDRGYTDLYVMNLADGQSTQITNTAGNEAEPNWTQDGKHISYLADGQLWEMNPDGTSPRQVTNIEGGINGYVYAPDMSKIVYLKDVKLEPTVQDLHPDLPKAQARIINDQFYRHWNDWVEGYTHLFIADYTAGQAITAGPCARGEAWSSWHGRRTGSSSFTRAARKWASSMRCRRIPTFMLTTRRRARLST